jgi:hypothetical protein
MWLEKRTLAFQCLPGLLLFDDDDFFLGGLSLMFPLGNDILMKMWQQSVGELLWMNGPMR